MINFEVASKVTELKKKYEDLCRVFNWDKEHLRMKELEKKMGDKNFWANKEEAKKYSKELNTRRHRIKIYESLKETFEEIDVVTELIEDGDASEEDLEEVLKKAKPLMDKFELETYLNEDYDDANAYLSIHPGAGGTESHDWADMLYRMYLRWSEKNGYSVETIEYQPGEEAGISSVTVKITGEYVYGYLKGEKGVHRLVRISPFDASKRRHTSFASVNVMPEVDENIDMDIRDEDLKVETFRASGHGGQYVNKTDSAVRITHLPTGIVVTCQNERSQHQNKYLAMQVLKAKLYALEMDKKQKEMLKLQGELKEIGWGSQIRSYVFHPYNMVKDHRTNHQTGNIQSVMDGEITPFIKAYLIWKASLRNK